ncbi:hypothetical protein LC593_13415 [Nostoc sp. CHAB 5844]|nr:hypothetical protein [Nostoc sp. CHAB 5844]
MVRQCVGRLCRLEATAERVSRLEATVVGSATPLATTGGTPATQWLDLKQLARHGGMRV